MATVAESLFGVTPESLMASRDAELQRQAFQIAQLSPEQRAVAGFRMAGGQLASGIGGLLGAEDPELMRVRQRQQLLQGVDISDPEALRGAASRLLQSGDSPAAAELAKRALDIEKAQAQITKDTAAAAASEAAAKRDRTPQTPADIAKAQRIAALRSAIPAYEAAGDTVTAKQLKDELEALLPADKIPSFGAEADRIAFAKYGKTFGQLTREQAAEVDKTIEQRDLASRKAGKTDVVLPGVKQAGDVTGLRKDLQAITKPYQDQADAATDAIDLANMALKNNNFAAVSSLSRSLAKAAGETQLTGKDVDAFGIDPSLVGRVSDTVSRLSQSRPTEDTLKKLRDLAQALKAKAEGRLQLEEDQLRETARVSGLFNESQINTVFRRRPAQGGGGANTRTTRSGVKYTVEND